MSRFRVEASGDGWADGDMQSRRRHQARSWQRARGEHPRSRQRRRRGQWSHVDPRGFRRAKTPRHESRQTADGEGKDATGEHGGLGRQTSGLSRMIVFLFFFFHRRRPRLHPDTGLKLLLSPRHISSLRYLSFTAPSKDLLTLPLDTSNSRSHHHFRSRFTDQT